MSVNLDNYVPFFHDASGKCDACTHLLHYIQPTTETSWPQSFFEFNLYIICLLHESQSLAC